MTGTYPIITQQRSESIRFDREWAMPTESTFDIDAIERLIATEIDASPGLWVDPFSGGTRYADVTNDLNPELPSDETMQATEFLDTFDEGAVDGGVLFDPPYSPRQIKECYESVGLETSMESTQATFWTDVKRAIKRVCGADATVVTCGWNSGGVGKNRGFSIRRILLVAHGGWHNDTIVTVEDRIRRSLSEFGGPET